MLYVFKTCCYITGPRALKMFGSKQNSELVTYILSRKLYDYLINTRTTVQVKNGEGIIEAHMPHLTIVDRCDLSMKSYPAYLKGTVRRSTYLKTGGDFRYLQSYTHIFYSTLNLKCLSLKCLSLKL